MAFQRSKFKGTQVSTIQDQQKDLDDKLPKGGNGNNRAGYLKIEEGSNRLRFYPGHPSQKSDAFIFPKMTHWLEVEQTYEKDNKTVTELKKKPIFNSRIHGDTPKDVIEEYLNFARKVAAEEMDDDKDRQTFLAPLEGFKSPYNIKGQLKWVAYADKIVKGEPEFGRVELASTVKDQMNSIATSSDEVDDVIETDPFSDPDEGRCLIVTYDKQENLPKGQKPDPKKYYSSVIDYKKTTPLTDEQLIHLEEQEPLEKIFKNCYRKKDFEIALDGLRRLDTIQFKELKNENYGFFDDPEFVAIVEEISGYYSDDDTSEEENKPASTKQAESKKQGARSVTAKELDETASDLPFDIELKEMSRDQLKGVIRREKLEIHVKPTHTEEDLVQMIEIEREIREQDEKEEDPSVEEELDEIVTSSRRSARGSRASRFQEED